MADIQIDPRHEGALLIYQCTGQVPAAYLVQRRGPAMLPCGSSRQGRQGASARRETGIDISAGSRPLAHHRIRAKESPHTSSLSIPSLSWRQRSMHSTFDMSVDAPPLTLPVSWRHRASPRPLSNSLSIPPPHPHPSPPCRQGIPLAKACMSPSSWADAGRGFGPVGDIRLLADLTTITPVPWHPSHAFAQVAKNNSKKSKSNNQKGWGLRD
jgi:hypothetical protein